MYVPAGRVGKLNLSHGCYTTYEVMNLAAAEIATSGAASEVRALLASGVTVRELLTQRYGCFLGPREYWHAEHLTPDQADRRDFLRILGRAKGARKTAV
jgi:hypothetical protein